MKDSNLGPSIKSSFEFLGKIFLDTSKFLTIIEEYMKKYNFISFYGATSVWDRSWAYYGSYGWLPHYLCRVYVTKDLSGKKPSIKEKKFIFVNIYFMPENVAQPVVLFGITELKEEAFDNTWSALMLTSSGPNFVNSDLLEDWDIFDGKKSSIDLIHYKVKPLVDFEGQVMAESNGKIFPMV